MAARSWLADALMASAVHGAMAAGLVAGFWDAGVCIVGILLDSLAAYGLWLTLYLKRRPGGAGDFRMLAKSFIGLSLGIWGFIGLFRTITIRDTALIATNFAVLKYLDPADLLEVASGMDEEGALLVLVVLAAVLLLVSLYFLAEILVAMPFGDVAALAACVVALRIVEILNYRRTNGDEPGKIAIAAENISELCLHVFVKGWIGALLMYFVAGSALPMAWAYLGWSYAHDLLLRPWLWRKFGTHLANTDRVAASTT